MCGFFVFVFVQHGSFCTVYNERLCPHWGRFGGVGDEHMEAIFDGSDYSVWPVKITVSAEVLYTAATVTFIWLVC